MSLLNVIKAGAVLSIGVMYYAAANRTVANMQIPDVRAEANKAKALGRQLDREIDKQIK